MLLTNTSISHVSPLLTYIPDLQWFEAAPTDLSIVSSLLHAFPLSCPGLCSFLSMVIDILVSRATIRLKVITRLTVRRAKGAQLFGGMDKEVFGESGHIWKVALWFLTAP